VDELAVGTKVDASLFQPGDRVDVMVDDLDGRTAVVIVPASGEDEP